MYPGFDREEKPDPLEGEEFCRVLGLQAGSVFFALSEIKLQLIRVRALPNTEVQAVGSRIYIGLDKSKRDIVSDVLGITRFRDLTSGVQLNLIDILTGIISDFPEKFISFYNRAGNLSLKMHAFEMLTGIGNKKAMEMVESRGRKGWATLEEIDSDCSINAAKLLAERFYLEFADQRIEPRLIELLVVQEEL